jgi:large subunit ribosomal protein L18
MAIQKSNKHLYVQFVDDEGGRTVTSVSTQMMGDAKLNRATAEALGKLAAEAAAKAGIRRVVVDRGGNLFHGRIKSLVDGAGAAGLDVGEKRERKDKTAVAAPEAASEPAAKDAKAEKAEKPEKPAKADKKVEHKDAGSSTGKPDKEAK